MTYQYLAEVKWCDIGYQCRKCGHTKYYKGVKPFSRRYMKCKYDESPTAGTMFDKCNLEQIKSENGKSFQDVHIHIMNLKGWLRGIHHHCSKERLQGYLDEYHFRYNRRSNMDTIFDSLIRKMVLNNPIRLYSDN